MVAHLNHHHDRTTQAAHHDCTTQAAHHDCTSHQPTTYHIISSSINPKVILFSYYTPNSNPKYQHLNFAHLSHNTSLSTNNFLPHGKKYIFYHTSWLHNMAAHHQPHISQQLNMRTPIITQF